MNIHGKIKASAVRLQNAGVVCSQAALSFNTCFGYTALQNSKDFITIAPATLGLGANQ